jgi:hypothetical protein
MKKRTTKYDRQFSSKSQQQMAAAFIKSIPLPLPAIFGTLPKNNEPLITDFTSKKEESMDGTDARIRTGQKDRITSNLATGEAISLIPSTKGTRKRFRMLSNKDSAYPRPARKKPAV